MADPFDAGDEVSVKAKSQKVKNLQERIDAVVTNLMAHRDGRALVWSLLSKTGVGATSFNQSNALMAFNEGKRAIGLDLWDHVMRVAPDQFPLMAREAREQ